MLDDLEYLIVRWYPYFLIICQKTCEWVYNLLLLNPINFNRIMEQSYFQINNQLLVSPHIDNNLVNFDYVWIVLVHDAAEVDVICVPVEDNSRLDYDATLDFPYDGPRIPPTNNTCQRENHDCFLFDSTLGFPGEGPDEIDIVIDSDSDDEIAFHVGADDELIDEPDKETKCKRR